MYFCVSVTLITVFGCFCHFQFLIKVLEAKKSLFTGSITEIFFAVGPLTFVRLCFFAQIVKQARHFLKPMLNFLLEPYQNEVSNKDLTSSLSCGTSLGLYIFFYSRQPLPQNITKYLRQSEDIFKTLVKVSTGLFSLRLSVVLVNNLES